MFNWAIAFSIIALSSAVFAFGGFDDQYASAARLLQCTRSTLRRHVHSRVKERKKCQGPSKTPMRRRAKVTQLNLLNPPLWK